MSGAGPRRSAATSSGRRPPGPIRAPRSSGSSSTTAHGGAAWAGLSSKRYATPPPPARCCAESWSPAARAPLRRLARRHRPGPAGRAGAAVAGPDPGAADAHRLLVPGLVRAYAGRVAGFLCGGEVPHRRRAGLDRATGPGVDAGARTRRRVARPLRRCRRPQRGRGGVQRDRHGTGSGRGEPGGHRGRTGAPRSRARHRGQGSARRDAPPGPAGHHRRHLDDQCRERTDAGHQPGRRMDRDPAAPPGGVASSTALRPRPRSARSSGGADSGR